MSQVKKFATGGSATPEPSKLKFKINGTDFDTDEQYLRDQFDPIFHNMVQAGRAKDSDREGWQNVYNQFINQARSGQYSINSSGNHAYDISYNGNSDGANLGLGADGNTARKSKLGELLSRRETDDSQRMASLNHFIGDRLINSFTSKQAADKAKADADAAKAKKDRLDALAGKTNILGQDFGQYAYGDDYKNSPELVGSKWWAKGVSERSQVNRLTNYFNAKYKALFNPELDASKDDLGDKWKDILSRRELVKSLYDDKGNLLHAPKTLKDFDDLTNAWDTMGADQPFLSKTTPAEQVAAEAQAKADATAKAQLPTQAGKYWTKDGVTYLDKDGKTVANGWHNNQLFDNGKLWNGAYVYNGDYNNPLTGYYLNGTKSNKDAYVKFYHDLQSNPENKSTLDILDKRYQDVMSAYNKAYNGLSKYKKPDDVDASRNLLSRYKGNLGGALNITGQFDGFDGKAGKIIGYYDDNSSDQFGNRVLRNKVRLANGKEFDGRLQIDPASQQIQLIKDNGEVENDHDLTNAFRGVKYNSSGTTDNNLDFVPSGNLNNLSNATSGKSSNMIDVMNNGIDKLSSVVNSWHLANGGVIKHQLGGQVTSYQDTGKNHETSIRDAYKAATDPNYHLSTQDKWELGALGTDLAGVLTSLTGAGSVVSGGLGAAGTLMQLGTDISRDGLDWGDVGRAAVGLGLDAASTIPGLGVFAKESKTLRTLSRVSKYIVPAMTAAGLVQGAGVVTDLVSGKKKLSDLSVDDLRSLTNGIHGIIGGARYATQRLGTTTGDAITLANGKKVAITNQDHQALEAAENPEEKIKLAKEIVSRAANIPVDQVELPKGKTLNMTWNPTKMLSTVEKVKVRSGEPMLRTPREGDGMWDDIVNKAIYRSAKRNPSLAPQIPGITTDSYQYNPETGNVDLNKGDSKQFGLLGDYFRKLNLNATPKGTSLGNAVEDARIAGSPAMRSYQAQAETSVQPEFTNLKGNNSSVKLTADQLQQVRAKNLVSVLPDGATPELVNKLLSTPELSNAVTPEDWQAGIKQIANATKSRMSGVTFKEGGKIIKANDGTVLDFSNLSGALKTANDFDNKYNGFLPYPARVGKAATPYNPILTGINNIIPGLGGKYNTAATIQAAKDYVAPYDQAAAEANLQAINRMKSGNHSEDTNTSGTPVQNNYRDYTPVSELGRALFTRQLNSQIDTRVERPMMQTSAQYSPSVRGNIYAQAQANKNADDLVRNSSIPRTSDGSLQAVMQLQAGTNAAQIRNQGAMANIDQLERTRQYADQVNMQNNQERANIANQNIQTNARATQAERQANNEKQAMMNQPLVDYWKDMDYKMYAQNQQNKLLDSQIGGLALQSRMSNQQFDMQRQMNQLYTQQDAALRSGDQAKYNELQDQITQKNKEFNYFSNQGQRAMLLLRKNPNWTMPDNWLTMPTQSTQSVTSNKDGGKLRADIENAKSTYRFNKLVSDDENKMNTSSTQEVDKKVDKANKDIQDMIKMALSGKK